MTLFCLTALAASASVNASDSASSAGNDSGELSAEKQYAQSNLTETAGEDLIEDLSPSNSSADISSNFTQIASSNLTENASEPSSKKAEIAAYVYNDDNDELEVSLFIDSLLSGKVEVDKGSQETFGNYSLDYGFHRFKIAWKDPDTDKAYESEQKEVLSGDDAIILYTKEHIEPEKYDLKVSVKNENDKETNAYLYIDTSYETTQKLSESSTTEFGKVSVEEGVHDISIRWLDPYTNAEYEKKKRVTIDDNKAVIFVATKGASFEDKGEVIEEADVSGKVESDKTPSSAFSMKAEVSQKATENEADDGDGAGNDNSTGTNSSVKNVTGTDSLGTNSVTDNTKNAAGSTWPSPALSGVSS